MTAETRATNHLSLRKKILFSFCVTVGLLCALELLLALFWQPPPPTDPFVGFSPSVPLLVQQETEPQETSEEVVAGQVKLHTNPAKRVWFNEQSIALTKPQGTYRIVCLGGSTTFGRPFDDTTSFCGWLREFLAAAAPEQNWEVFNAGGVSYASYRVAAVMEEFDQYDVDLFVLYTGQNEFLEWRTYGDLIASGETSRRLAALATKTHVGQAISSLVDEVRSASRDKPTMSAEVDEILNHSVGPASYQRDVAWYRGVEQHFRTNLRRMQKIAQQAGARLAVITPASNLRDCAPFKSEFDDSIDDPARRQLIQRFERASELIAKDQFGQALVELQAIEQVDRKHAGVHFLSGRALLALGEVDQAENRFQLAIDHDICPLRATTAIKQSVREFIDAHDVIDVDFESQLGDQLFVVQGHRCFGAESFLDHVHPTIDVHRQLGEMIVDALFDAGIVARPLTPDQVLRVTDRVMQGVDRRAQGIAFRNLAKVTHWAGKFEEAERSARDALRLLPTDAESRFILADCLDKAGLKDQAIAEYTRLFDGGGFDRACLPFGELLAQQGHNDAAKAYLMQAVLVSEGASQALAYDSLGRLHQSLGETELAADCFEQAAELRW